MDVGIIIITHGRLADAFRETLFSIVGMKQNIISISIPTECTLKSLCENVKHVISTMGTQYVIVFTDMLGGTACSSSMMVCHELQNVFVISGVNLYMLLTAVNLRENNLCSSIEEYIDKIITEGKKCISNVNEVLFKKCK